MTLHSVNRIIALAPAVAAVFTIDFSQLTVTFVTRLLYKHMY